MADASGIIAGQAYISIGASLRRLDAGLAAAKTKLAAAGASFQRMGLTTFALGGVIAAPFALGVKAAMGFQKAMVEVAKVTDEVTARAVGRLVREMGRNMPLATEQIAQIAADVARFGVRGAENIAKFTEAVAKMSVATDISAEDAGMALAKLAKLTDTPFDAVENLGSAINSLGNTMATSQSQIVDNALRAAPALNALGMTNVEILALSASINEVSASSRRAGTRLRRLANALMEPRKMQQIAAAVGMTADEFKHMRDTAPLKVIKRLADEFKKGSKQADKLRGVLTGVSSQALDALAKNLKGLDGALKTSNEEFEKGTSMQREFALQMQTADGQMQIMKNRVRDLAISIGMPLLNAVSRAAAGIGKLADRARVWVDTNQQAVVMGAKLALTFLGVGAAVLAIGMALKFLGILFGPAGVMAAGITAALLLGDALGITNSGFLTFLENVRIGGTKIGTWLTAGWLKAFEAWEVTRSGLAIGFDTLVTAWKTASISIVSIARTACQAIWDYFKRGYNDITDSLKLLRQIGEELFTEKHPGVDILLEGLKHLREPDLPSLDQFKKELGDALEVTELWAKWDARGKKTIDDLLKKLDILEEALKGTFVGDEIDKMSGKAKGLINQLKNGLEAFKNFADGINISLDATIDKMSTLATGGGFGGRTLQMSLMAMKVPGRPPLSEMPSGPKLTEQEKADAVVRNTETTKKNTRALIRVEASLDKNTARISAKGEPGSWFSE